MFKIDPSDKELWDKYSPEKFPVISWKATPRDSKGKDTGSIYVLPRTPEGLVKIGYRGLKVSKQDSQDLLEVDHILLSSPISYLPLMALLLLRTDNGRCLYQQRIVMSYKRELSMLSGSLSTSSCQISLKSHSTQRNYAGTPTPWTIPS